MRKFIQYLIVCMALAIWPNPTIAQQPPTLIDQALKSQLGDLLFNNTIMNAELKRLTEENAKLKSENLTLKKANEDAKQEPKASTTDGGSRP